MKKIILISAWFLCGLILPLLPVNSFCAEKIPAISEIPADTPAAAKERLCGLKMNLEKELADFQTAAAKFNAKDVKEQSDADYDALAVWRSRYVEAVNSFNEETSLEKKIIGYKEALRRQQKTIEMGSKELAEWTQKNEEAQTQALKAGATLFFKSLAFDMENRMKSAQSFQGWLTRYEKAIKEKGLPFEILQTKIEKAYHGYAMAMISAKSGQVLRKGMLAKDLWQNIRSEASVIKQQQTKADSDIMDTLNDPQLKKYFEKDHAGQEFAESLLTLMGQTKDLGKIIGPQVELGTFIVDYGYAAAEWTASRNRIMQQYNLADQELQAVNKLKERIEEAEKKLHRIHEGK